MQLSLMATALEYKPRLNFPRPTSHILVEIYTQRMIRRRDPFHHLSHNSSFVLLNIWLPRMSESICQHRFPNPAYRGLANVDRQGMPCPPNLPVYSNSNNILANLRLPLILTYSES